MIHLNIHSECFHTCWWNSVFCSSLTVALLTQLTTLTELTGKWCLDSSTPCYGSQSFNSTVESRQMWQGLQHITYYRTRTISSTDSLSDDLNTFYTRLETSSPSTEVHNTPPLHQQSNQEDPPLQGSRATQHPWCPESMCR